MNVSPKVKRSTSLRPWHQLQQDSGALKPRTEGHSSTAARPWPSGTGVTVLIAAYNDAEHLDRCLGSVFAQTYQNFDVLCINDCSTDHSLTVMKVWQQRFGAGRFTIINNHTNLGLTHSLQLGLQKITARYTARLDGDDWWQADKLEKQVDWLTQHPGYGLVGCHFRGLTTATKRIKRHYFDVEDSTIKRNLFKRNPFAHSAVIFDTALAKKVGGYNEQCIYGQDYDLWLRLAPHTRFYNLNEFLCWRNTDTGISIHKQRLQMLQSFKTRYKYINKYHYSKLNYIHLIEPLILIITPDFIKRIKRNFLPSNIGYFKHLMSGTKTNVLYINDTLLPNKFANAVARIAMAKAFAQHPEVENTIFFYQATPAQQKPLVKNYQGRERHQTVYLLIKKKNVITVIWNAVIFSLYQLRMFFLHIPPHYDLLYLRTGSLAGLMLSLRNIWNRRKIFFEIHNYEFGHDQIFDMVYHFIFWRCNRLITVSEHTKQNWVAHGIAAKKILVLPSATDLSIFQDIRLPKEQLKEQVGFSKDKTILLYCGHLYRDRGIEDIIYVADYLRENHNLQFVLLGGANQDIAYYDSYIHRHYPHLSNVIFLGHVSSELIPYYLKAADVIFATYSRQCPTINHMSPMKLFESIATNIPMIIADVPRVRDIVNNTMVTFYQPDEAADLAAKTQWVLRNYPQARVKAEAAYVEAQKYTWQSRINAIIQTARSVPT